MRTATAPATVVATPPVASAAALRERVNALTRHFTHVQTVRMAGIPLLNDALGVEAVGFEWAAADAAAAPVAEGVLITPWFMSLVRLPLQVLPHGNRVGRSVVHPFGCERFDFIGAHDEAIGFHETCALFSPMNGFTSQALARETALASLALVRPAVPAQADTQPAPSAATYARPVEPVPSRRFFIMGRPRRNGGVT